MRQKLSLITLGVHNLAQTAQFYENALGWKRSAASVDDLIVYSLGTYGIALFERAALAEDIGVANTPTGFSNCTLAHNTASAAEVDTILAAVKAHGATITKAAEKTFWGGYSGYFQDPNGHIFEVVYNPFWELDAQGNLRLP